MNITILSLVSSSILSHSPVFIKNQYSLKQCHFQNFLSLLFYNPNNLDVRDTSFYKGQGGIILIGDSVKNDPHWTYSGDFNSSINSKNEGFSNKRISVTFYSCSFITINSNPIYISPDKIDNAFVNISVYITRSTFAYCNSGNGVLYLENCRCITITHTCSLNSKGENTQAFLFAVCNPEDFLIFLYNSIITDNTYSCPDKEYKNIFSKSGNNYFRCINMTNFPCRGWGLQFDDSQCFSFGMSNLINCNCRTLEISGKNDNNQSYVIEMINIKTNNYNELIKLDSDTGFTCTVYDSVLLNEGGVIFRRDSNRDKCFLVLSHCRYKGIPDNQNNIGLGLFEAKDESTEESSFDVGLNSFQLFINDSYCPGVKYISDDQIVKGCNVEDCVNGHGDCQKTVGFPSGVVSYETFIDTRLQTAFFTPTNSFSPSQVFSSSKIFSHSKEFTSSQNFSPSNFFSRSKSFSPSHAFSSSSHFSASTKFSSSAYFSSSRHFTGSHSFSSSKSFTGTKLFSSSQKFSESTKFTSSGHFTFSSDFTKSDRFTNTKQFSSSFYFTNSGEFSGTGAFSETIDFTKSELFTKSADFTPSHNFTASHFFNATETFTPSNVFSLSGQFSDSFDFSESAFFSLSRYFSYSSFFSETQNFSYSEYFSGSQNFSVSSLFTFSNEFSNSGGFSSSKKFTPSNDFNATHTFSPSNPFTASSPFNESSHFTCSSHFTGSNHFSGTTAFTDSLHFTFSKWFTKSSEFSKTKEFTPSNHFDATHKFTASSKFTHSSFFTDSGVFTASNAFTKSAVFLSSGKFTSSSPFSQTQIFTFSDGFTPSKTIKDKVVIVVNQEKGRNKAALIGGIVAAVVSALAIGIAIIAFIIIRHRRHEVSSDMFEELNTIDNTSSTITYNNVLHGLDMEDDPFEDDFH